MKNILNRSLIFIGLFLFLIGVLLFIIFLPVPKPYILSHQSSILKEVNILRENYNEPDLVEIAVLDKSAYLKAKDMLDHNYFSHTDSKGRDWYGFIVQVGFKHGRAGENLGRNYSDDTDLVDAFMNSPEHRANLLNSKYQYFGFARVGRYEVMHFGGTQ